MVSCLIEGAIRRISPARFTHSTNTIKRLQKIRLEPEGHRSSSPLDAGKTIRH